MDEQKVAAMRDEALVHSKSFDTHMTSASAYMLNALIAELVLEMKALRQHPAADQQPKREEKGVVG